MHILSTATWHTVETFPVDASNLLLILGNGVLADTKFCCRRKLTDKKFNHSSTCHTWTSHTQRKFMISRS